MTISNWRALAWAPALLIGAVACRNDNPSGSGPTPALPSTAPVQGGTPPGSAGAPAATPGSTSSNTASGPSARAGTADPSASAAVSGPLSDGQIAAITDGLNSGEIEQAKIAKTKSKNKDVLGFANMMIEHHGQAKEQLAALKETQEPSPLATQLSTDAQATLTRLNQASGPEFDRAYIEAQVQGHQKALDTLTQKLLPSAKAPELTKYLRELQPKIEQHLTRARALEGRLSRTTSKEPTGTGQQTAAKAPSGSR